MTIKQLVSPIKLHVVFWFIFIAYEISFSYSYSHGFAPFLDYLTAYIVNISIFYIHAFLLYRFFERSKKSYAFIGLLTFAELVFYVSLKYILFRVYSASGLNWSPVYTTKINFIRDNLWRGLYFIGFGTAYSSLLLVKHFNKQLTLLKTQQLINDKERLKMEIAFLRSQINPHFIFNTLGCIHAKVSKESFESGDAIILLSDLLRHAISKINDNGFISLNSELEQLQNYIELNKFRYDYQLNIELIVRGQTDNVEILPLIFLTVIENIFKYGDLESDDRPAIISITVSEKQIVFKATNFKRQDLYKREKGLGLENLRKRLAQFYKEDFKMTVADNGLQFNVIITIPSVLN